MIIQLLDSSAAAFRPDLGDSLVLETPATPALVKLNHKVTPLTYHSRPDVTDVTDRLGCHQRREPRCASPIGNRPRAESPETRVVRLTFDWLEEMRLLLGGGRQAESLKFQASNLR